MPRGLPTLARAEHHHHMQIGRGVERRRWIRDNRLMDQDARVIRLGGGCDVR